MVFALGLLLICVVGLFVLWWVEDVIRLHQLQALRARINGQPAGVKRKLKTPRKEQDLGMVAIEVAARLRAGSSTVKAWRSAWQRIVGDEAGQLNEEGVPQALLQLERETRKSSWWRGSLGRVPVKRAKRLEIWETAWILVTSCRFSATTGAPIAEVLEQTGKNMALARQARGEQRVAFAGPRISARILAGLPLLGILLAALLGANPLSWFFTSGFAMLVGLAGLGLFVGGVVISQSWVIRAEEETRGWVFAPFLCDLAGAGLSCGMSIPSVLSALGRASDNRHLQVTSAELVLGSPWEEAWTPTPDEASLLKTALQPAWEDGVSPSALLTLLSQQMRENRNLEAREAAGKLGVKLALPLAGMLLPAFVLLAIVPIVANLMPSLGL